MNPLLSEAISSVLRHVLTIAAGFLVTHGVWTADSAANYVTAAALAIVGIGWSLYQKFVSRSKLVTALASATPMSETAVEAKVAAGGTPSPAAPKADIPAPKE